jgi:hypothetical protein
MDHRLEGQMRRASRSVHRNLFFREVEVELGRYVDINQLLGDKLV